MSATGWSRNEQLWSPEEKKAAHRAFDLAKERWCAAIHAEVKRMLEGSSSPTVIWEIHDYLSERRRAFDETLDFRYSVLTGVFGILLHQGWLKESDFAGLHADKIVEIKRCASV
jgi:hypothetical protein